MPEPFGANDFLKL